MNEKMKILKMLEDGKITSAQASQLLQSLDGTATSPPPPLPQTPPTPVHTAPTPHTAYTSHPAHTTHHTAHRSQQKPPADIGLRLDSIVQDIGPKMQRVMAAVADRIDDVAGRVASAFTHDDHPAPQSYHRPKPATTSSGGLTHQDVELHVDTGAYNELNIAGCNGAIHIKGYNGDKITARLSCRPKKHGAKIELMKLGGKYFLKYEPDEFQSVSIDAYIPERAFKIIQLEGMNAMLECSSLVANQMTFSNSNGAMRLSGLSAEKIIAEASNGHFEASNIIADVAQLENLNGAMETAELEISSLQLTNYNSTLSMIMSKFEHYTTYDWKIETANAKLAMNLPTLPTLGYHIKAHAAMGEIRLGLTGLQYLISEPSLVEARSVHYDTAPCKVKINAETSNAPLTIS